MAAGQAIDRRGAVGMSALAATLTAVTVALIMGVSSLMLARLGISYDQAGGPGWQKIHPATFTGLLAMLALFVSAGNPVTVLDDIIRRQPGALVFLVSTIAVLAYYLARFGGPVTQLIDTFVLPWILFVLLTRRPESWLRAAALGLHAFMAMNALLAFAEFALGFRLTPIIAEGIVLTGDWRSSALLGHPLSNAAAASVYAFVVLVGGARDLPGWARTAAIMLQAAAMPVYGGRLATVIFAIFAMTALLYFAWIYRDRIRFTPAAAGGGVLAGLAGAISLTLAALSGYFDKFILRFVDDQGSAAARQSMFDLVARLPEQNFWLGSDPVYVATLQRLEGIPFGIESFWVAMTVNYGLLIALPFFLCLFYFLYEYVRATRPATAWVILMYLLIISGSTALAGKTTSFAHFTVIVLVLLRRERRAPES